MSDFNSVWERVKSLTGWKRMNQMAGFLDIKAQSISAQKNKNNQFLLDWAWKIAKEFNSTVEWIMEGRGPKSINDAPEMVREDQAPYNVTGGGVFSAREKQIVIMLRSIADGDPASFENIYQNVVENYMLMKENIR